MQRAEAFTMAGLGALVGGVVAALGTFWLVGSPSPKVEKEKAVASGTLRRASPTTSRSASLRWRAPSGACAAATTSVA